MTRIWLKKDEDAKEQASEGKSFLTEAKARHRKVFTAFLKREEEWPSLEEYSNALEVEAWKVTEEIAKQSWRNGIARGQARQKGDRR